MDFDIGSMDLIKYLPGLRKVSYQSQIAGVWTKRKYVDPNYTNKNTIEFNIFNGKSICKL